MTSEKSLPVSDGAKLEPRQEFLVSQNLFSGQAGCFPFTAPKISSGFCWDLTQINSALVGCYGAVI